MARKRARVAVELPAITKQNTRKLRQLEAVSKPVFVFFRGGGAIIYVCSFRSVNVSSFFLLFSSTDQ